MGCRRRRGGVSRSGVLDRGHAGDAGWSRSRRGDRQWLTQRRRVGAYLRSLRGYCARALPPLPALCRRILRARVPQALVLAAAVAQHLRRRGVRAGWELAAVVRDAGAGGDLFRGGGGRAYAAQAQGDSRRALATRAHPAPPAKLIGAVTRAQGAATCTVVLDARQLLVLSVSVTFEPPSAHA